MKSQNCPETFQNAEKLNIWMNKTLRCQLSQYSDNNKNTLNYPKSIVMLILFTFPLTACLDILKTRGGPENHSPVSKRQAEHPEKWAKMQISHAQTSTALLNVTCH